MTTTRDLQPSDRVTSEYGPGTVEKHTGRVLVYKLDTGETINVAVGTHGYYRVTAA